MTNILANDERDYPTPPPGYKKGYARDYERHPFGYSRVVKAFDLPLIPENEWAERLEYQKATKSRLSDIRNRGLSGRPIPSLDQNGVGYCWCHGPVSALLLARAVAGLPFVDLSPFAVGCLIKNYRDEGGWGIEAMEFMAERGCPSSAFWPHRAMRREYDTPATWANAKLHIQTEWMELEPRNKAQMVTCLLSNLPICAGYDHWAHEVCLMDLENLSPLRVRLWNSWSDNWEDNGTGILEGSKALGDGWECVRVVTPSTE